MGLMIPGGLMVERVTLLATTRILNDAGGWTDGWAAAATVNGRRSVGPRPTFEKLIGGEFRDADVSQFVLDLRGGVTLTSGQRLETTDGAQWEIVAMQQVAGLATVLARRV